jgi:hypothetical protein
MRSACVLLLALLLPSLAAAQLLDTTTIAQINAATRAQLRLRSGARGVVHQPAATASTVAFASAEFLTPGGNRATADSPLPVGEIERIQVAIGNAALGGAKIGAGIGAGLALVAALVTAGEDFVSLTPAEAAVSIVVTAGFGGLVGALIGSGSTRWQTVYPAAAP